VGHPDDPITLDAAERLGWLLGRLGRLDEAEALLRQNVDDRRRVLRPEHEDTLRSIYLLSRLLRHRKAFAEAEVLAYSYAHSIQCARPNHPDLVLALTYQHAAVEAHRLGLRPVASSGELAGKPVP
jgi:hypothetical protein